MKEIVAFIVAVGALLGPPLVVNIVLPDTYRQVTAGENLWFLVNMSNAGEDAIIAQYELRDMNGALVTNQSVSARPQGGALVGILKVPDDTAPGEYRLRVKVNSSNGGAESDAVLKVVGRVPAEQEVRTSSLFDIIVSVPDRYRTLTGGEELLASVKLINVGSDGRVDVFLDYWITDSDGAELLRRRETVAVETQANFVRSFDIPDDTKPGVYALHARITYADGKLAESSHTFEILRKASHRALLYVGAGVAAAILITIGIIAVPKDYLRRRELRSRIAHIVRQRRQP
jgi:hypothetical protein